MWWTSKKLILVTSPFISHRKQTILYMQVDLVMNRTNLVPCGLYEQNLPHPTREPTETNSYGSVCHLPPMPPSTVD